VFVGQQLVNDKPHAPHIGTLAIVVVAPYLFRRHEDWRACIIALLSALVIIINGKAEVNYLTLGEVAVLHVGYHDVLSLQVSMNNVHIIVQVCQAL
jgi:hypothetical protein